MVSMTLRSMSDDLVEGENTLMYICQEGLRTDMDLTFRRFIKFTPMSDKTGVLRAKGRLEDVDLPEQMKHPILLPGEHPLVHIIIIKNYCIKVIEL